MNENESAAVSRVSRVSRVGADLRREGGALPGARRPSRWRSTCCWRARRRRDAAGEAQREDALSSDGEHELMPNALPLPYALRTMGAVPRAESALDTTPQNNPPLPAASHG